VTNVFYQSLLQYQGCVFAFTK